MSAAGYFEAESDDDSSNYSCSEYVPAAASATFADDDSPPATQEEIFDDLTTRFIANLPDEELCSLVRACVRAWVRACVCVVQWFA